MKLQIHTLAYGSPEYLEHCSPTLFDYASRQGAELVVWDDTPRGYPCVKFVLIDMMRAFLDSDSTHMLYIDADVYIHPSAPLPDLSEPGLHARTDRWHAAHFKRWRPWCKEHYGFDVTRGAAYYNAGLWGCDRDAAKRVLAEVTTPHVEYFQDQHAWNGWIEKARQRGLHIHNLPIEWNRWGNDPGPAWFFHLWGYNKMRDLDVLRKGDYLR